jgi:SanA protein
MRRWIVRGAVLTGLLGLIVLTWTLWTLLGRFHGQIYRGAADVPRRPVAVVFGAGYWPSGRLSDVLQDRLDAAVALYRAERVEKLLFSGDNRVEDYNEPRKMLEYALELGVPRDDIVLDYAGRRTYDTCYRARDIFRVDEVVLVTNRYHLPRALLTCRTLGLESVGYVADRQSYVKIGWYWLREFPALWLSWWDLHVAHPTPVLGEPLPIFAAEQD